MKGSKSTDTHQFLDPSSSHPYHCKKGIPYSQALRLNRIRSDNESFGKRCNDLEGCLMERGYNGKDYAAQSCKTMPLEFIYLNSPPVVAVNCDNRKAMGKEKWHKAKCEKSTKNDSIEFRKKKAKKT